MPQDFAREEEQFCKSLAEPESGLLPVGRVADVGREQVARGQGVLGGEPRGRHVDVLDFDHEQLDDLGREAERW